MPADCTNYSTCPLINNSGFISEPGHKDHYIKKYCRAGDNNWSKCKRYLMKRRWQFCPDFVLPDTPGSTDEILDKFEEEQ